MPDLVRQVALLGVCVAVLCGVGALLPRPRLGPVAALPACAANTLALVTVAAVAADAAGFGLGAVVAALVGAGLIAAFWRLRRAAFARSTRAGEEAPGSPQRRGLPFRLADVFARPPLMRGDVACFAVALTAAVLALWSGTWFSHSADTFYHLAAARTQLLDGTALPHRVFVPELAGPDPTSGTWHVVLALLAWLTAHDVASIWAVLTPLAAGLSALGFAALGRAASGSGWVGAVGALAYLIFERRLDLRTAPFPNEVAWLPLAMALTAMLAHSRWGAYAAIAAWTAAAGGVHLAQYGAALALLTALLAVALAVPALRRGRLAASAAVALLAALTGGALLGGYRLLTWLGTPTGLGALGIGAPLAQPYLSPWSALELGWSLTLADPGVWFRSSALLLAALATLMLLRRAWAGQPGAALLVVGAWLVPAVLLNPLLAPLTLERFSYAVAKTATLLRPLPFLGAAWALIALAAPDGAGWRRVAARAVAALVVLFALAQEAPRVAATTFGPADPQQHSVAASRDGDLRRRWADLLATLDGLPGRAVILADPETSYALGGLTRHWVVAVPQSHSPAQVEARGGALRRGDALDAFYQGPERAAEVLERYGVTHVVAVERFGAALGALPFLVRLAAGSTWQLYAYDPSRLSQALDIALTSVGDGVQVGVLRSLVPAGGVALVRVVGAPGGARLALRHGTDELAARSLPAGGDAVVGLLVPPDAPVGPAVVHLAAPRPTVGPAVVVGREVEAELLAGLSPNRDYDYERVPGWASYTMSFFSRQRAATSAQVGSRLRGLLPGLAPGSYRLRLRVYDYGSGRRNVLRVWVGGVAADVAWEGSRPGMRWVETPISGIQGADVEIEVLDVGQGRVVLDALALYPR